MHSIREFLTLYRYLQVTSGQMTPLGSLPVTWGHVMSFNVTWLLPPASYSFIGSQRRRFTALWSHFQVTSSQMTSLTGHFGSPEVTWCLFLSRDCLLLELQSCRKSNAPKTRVVGPPQQPAGDFRSNDVTSGNFRSPVVMSRHFLSCDCLLLWATAVEEVKRTKDGLFQASTANYRWLPVKLCHFRVTSGHLRSRDVISCHGTDSCCKIQPCRKSNEPKAPVFSPLQPLPAEFRKNGITSGYLRSLHIISFHVTASSCELQPCRKSNAQKTTFWPSTATSRRLLVKWHHFRVISSHQVTLHHFLSRDCLLLRAPAL